MGGEAAWELPRGEHRRRALRESGRWALAAPGSSAPPSLAACFCPEWLFSRCVMQCLRALSGVYLLRTLKIKARGLGRRWELLGHTGC